MGFRRKFKNCTVKPAQTLGRPSPPPHFVPAQSYMLAPVTLLSDRRRVPMHSAPVTNPEASLDVECFPLTLGLVLVYWFIGLVFDFRRWTHKGRPVWGNL